MLNGTMGRWDVWRNTLLLIMCKIPYALAAVSEFLCIFANVNAHATACGQGQRHIESVINIFKLL